MKNKAINLKQLDDKTEKTLANRYYREQEKDDLFLTTFKLMRS